MRYIYIFCFSYDVLTAQQYKRIYDPTLLLQKMKLIKKLENDKNNGEGHSLQQNDKIMIILLYIIALQLMFTIWPLIQIHILFFSCSFFCLMGPVSDSS